MKIKYLLLGIGFSLITMSLSGCGDANLPEITQVHGTNKEHIAYKFEKWNELIDKVNKISDEVYEKDVYAEQGVDVSDIDDDITISSTYTGEDRSYIEIRNVDSRYGKEAVNLVSEYVGNEVFEMISKARALEVDDLNLDQGKTVAKVIGDYGVVVEKLKDRVELYVVYETFSLSNKQDQDFISLFKTPDFIMKSYSEGKDESLIEIISPICKKDISVYNEIDCGSYYQFFRNTGNELIKARMVINKGEAGFIHEEEFGPLKKIISYFDEEESFYVQIQEAITSALEGKSQARKIQGSHVNAIIKVNNFNDISEFITITIE